MYRRTFIINKHIFISDHKLIGEHKNFINEHKFISERKFISELFRLHTTQGILKCGADTGDGPDKSLCATQSKASNVCSLFLL